MWQPCIIYKAFGAILSLRVRAREFEPAIEDQVPQTPDKHEDKSVPHRHSGGKTALMEPLRKHDETRKVV